MYDGLEIDMLSLGDADCIIVTQWTAYLGPQRILIDGGKASDFPIVKEFLLSRGMTDIWATVCTHLHGDHAGGLIKLVQDPSITIRTAWMHNICNHVPADALRRASAGNSPRAKDVKHVWETTKELASAFEGRGLKPQEPFAGTSIASVPSMTVLGPSLSFYKKVIGEFTEVQVPWVAPASFLGVLSGIGPGPSGPLSTLLYAPAAPQPNYRNYLGVFAPALPLPPAVAPLSSLAGMLKNSSVEESPSTQTFNNTSVILGMVFNSRGFMFTADAGSDALDRVPVGWRKLWWMQVPHHGSDGNLSKGNIERFCPTTAYVSACGDTSHPDRAIVNGLSKLGGTVYSTHTLGHLHHHQGTVAARPDYGPAVPLKGTSEPVVPSLHWLSRLSDMR